MNRKEVLVATGEQIVVSTHRISLPTCGEFDAELKEQKSSIQDQRRTYQATLQLKPGQPDLLCSVNAGETLRLQIAVSVGYHADAGFGEFNVYKAQEVVPVFSADAWNFSRDNPCDSGSAFGSAACLQYANAKVIKALAYESYSASSEKSSGNQSMPRDMPPSQCTSAPCERLTMVGVAVRVHPLDLRDQDVIRSRSSAGLSPRPGVEAAARDTVYAAHHLDAVDLPVRVDEAEGFFF